MKRKSQIDLAVERLDAQRVELVRRAEALEAAISTLREQAKTIIRKQSKKRANTDTVRP